MTTYYFGLLVLSHLPPFYLPFLFKWSGDQTSTKSHKRKRCQGTVFPASLTSTPFGFYLWTFSFAF